MAPTCLLICWLLPCRIIWRWTSVYPYQVSSMMWCLPLMLTLATLIKWVASKHMIYSKLRCVSSWSTNIIVKIHKSLCDIWFCFVEYIHQMYETNHTLASQEMGNSYADSVASSWRRWRPVVSLMSEFNIVIADLIIWYDIMLLSHWVLAVQDPGDIKVDIKYPPPLSWAHVTWIPHWWWCGNSIMWDD